MKIRVHLWRRVTDIVLSLAMVTSVCAFAEQPRSRTTREFGISGDTATLALLRRARATIGPEERIRRIEGFTIEPASAKSRSYRVLFPDRFRVDYPTVSTVVHGKRFWQKLPPGVPGDPGDGRQAAFVRNMVALCVKLFLRAPEAHPLEARRTGLKTMKGLTGEGVELRFQDGTLVHELILDSRTSRPLGAAATMKRQDGQAYLYIERFDQHRVWSGLTLPMRIHEERVYQQSEESLAGSYEIGRIVLDPPPDQDVFRNPAMVR